MVSALAALYFSDKTQSAPLESSKQQNLKLALLLSGIKGVQTSKARVIGGEGSLEKKSFGLVKTRGKLSVLLLEQT